MNGSVLKIEESQEEALGKAGGDERERNDGIGNLSGDKYKHNRQQLTLSKKLFEINIWVDKYQEEHAYWMMWVVESK